MRIEYYLKKIKKSEQLRINKEHRERHAGKTYGA